MGHHPDALRGDPLRRDAGRPRRQAQDRAADRGHRPAAPAPGPARGRLVAVGRMGGHRGRHRADGADRSGVRQGRVGPAAGRARRPAGGLRR
ncbi:hypothetical protein MICRO116_190011 [Micrococcus sp. 116]|nr:hypothetical protein MICRO116_190011 [Micrococcus sp. 116]